MWTIQIDPLVAAGVLLAKAPFRADIPLASAAAGVKRTCLLHREMTQSGRRHSAQCWGAIASTDAITRNDIDYDWVRGEVIV